jgi:hypothetical protein
VEHEAESSATMDRPGTLTGRERFLRTVHCQPVDRGCNWELGLWGQTTERWLHEGMPDDIHLARIGNLIQYGEYFGLDRVVWYDISCDPIPRFEYEVLEEDERYIVFRDGFGMVRRGLKEGTVRGTRMSMDTYLDFPIKTREDWLQFRKRLNPKSPARYPMWWEDEVRALCDRTYPLLMGRDAAFGLYWKLRELMGTMGVSYAFFDQPALIEEILEYLTDFYIEIMHPALHQVEFDMMVFSEDHAGKGGPLISPAIFKKFFARHYRRIADFVKSHGVPLCMAATDGYTVPLIGLLLDCGVDGQGPLECAAGMDPIELRRQFGTDLFLMGGIDKLVLPLGKEAIDRELYRKIPPLLDQGRYIPMIDHTVPPDVPYANWLYYLEVKKRLLEGHYV